MFNPCKLKQFIVSVILLFLFHNCLQAQPLRKESPFALSLTVDAYNPTCQKINGKIFARASGGQAPYHYTCGSFGPNSSGNFTRLPAGSYTVTVTDANGSSDWQLVNLVNVNSEPMALLLNTSISSGCSTNDATISLAAAGGQPPYNFSLDNIHFQTANVFSTLSAGIYMYTVKDANGCTSFPSATSNIVSIAANCPLECRSASIAVLCNPYRQHIFLTDIHGGIPPYTYSKDGIHYQAANDFDSLEEGYHHFWIRDAAGAVATYDISYMDDCNKDFLLQHSVTPAHCGPNGTITVTATEGVLPYLYSIDGINFQPGNIFTGLAAGNYVITVRDAYGLEATRLATVPESCLALLLSAEKARCSKKNGSIHALAYNGQPPYQYSIDGIQYFTSPDFTGLLPGIYTVYLRDAAGMLVNDTIRIGDIPAPVIDSVIAIPTGCDNLSGSLSVYANGGTAPLAYLLENGVRQTQPVFNALPAGNYNAIVIDATGCSDTLAASITMHTQKPVVNLGADTTLCETQTITLVAGAAGEQTYLWQDGSTGTFFTVTQPGRYFVTANRKGCLATDTILVNYLAKPLLDLGPDQSICSGIPYTIAPHLQGVSYLWQDGSTDSIYQARYPGLYELMVSNRCGTASDAIRLQTAVCDIYVPNAFTPNQDGKNDNFRIGYGENIIRFEMRVFNRYGKTIFISTDKTKGWDGRYRGQLQPVGTYSWFIRYQTATAPVWQEMQGSLLLIR